MASRAEQKAKARAERIEFERKIADEARRKQRLARLAGVVLAAAVIIVAAIVISSSNNTSKPITTKASKTIQTRVNSLLSGIPEPGNNVLGNANAPIQVTEYGDLECSACDLFALPASVNTSAGVPGSGVQDQLINTYVKTGKASLVYRSLDTATGQGATPQMFPTQQSAAYAAGLQGKAWYYIELFYAEQQPEGNAYVTPTFLDNLAKQVPGLNFSKWKSDLSTNSRLAAQVTADASAAQASGYTSTPTVVVRGPKGQQAISGVPTWAGLQQAIKSVS